MGCPPALVYKGARGGPAKEEEARPRGSPTPTGSRTPSFLVQLGEGGKEGERRKERGAAPLVQFGPEGGRMPPPFWPLSSIPVWPNKAHILPGEFP